MSKDVNLNKVKELYDQNIRDHGAEPESVGWGNQEKIDLRFEKLLDVVEMPNEEFSVSELGCGYGELVKYCENYSLNLGDYEGYDISEDMLVAAREYVQGERITWVNSDKVLKKADYVIASGIFNVPFDNDRDQWKSYVLSTIEHLFEMSNKGASFNMLTKYVDYESENLFYNDPLEIFDHCKRNLTNKVNLVHDYPLYEFTIHLIK